MQGLMPEDGTPILNRVLRVMVSRRLGQRVTEDEFFKALDALQSAEKIGRLRGQGGQTFLSFNKVAPVAPRTKPPRLPEADLMEPLRLYLDGPFRRGLDLPDGSVFIAEDTSKGGPLKGKWARPDFIVVTATRFKLLPGCQVDLHSFELKTQSGGSVLAIHEALAQTRFTHFGHFVWHLPKGAREEAMLDDIVTHCEEHGIGLIRIFDPTIAGNDDGSEILVDPKRKPTLPGIVDGFLEARLNSPQKNKLQAFVGASR